MISDFQTNTIYFSDLLQKDARFAETSNEISAILDSVNINYKFLPPCTKDIWARDYMPIQVSKNKFIEFRYDPDYLQDIGKYGREIKTYTDLVCDSLSLTTVKSDIIIDGGNVVKSENTVILTDKIIQENKNRYNQKSLIKKLAELFETERIVLIPWDKKEKFGHADGMLRFINENKVLINGIYRKENSFKNQLLKTLEANKINWDWISFNVEKENSRNWAYINFLQTKDIILIPKFEIEEDNQALGILNKHFPIYAEKDRIIQVDMRRVVKFGGALNCISWTIQEMDFKL
jgi:agmatine/peptidylarginine deiminase